MNNPQHFVGSKLVATLSAATPHASSSIRESPSAILWLEDTSTRTRVTGGDGEIIYQGTKHTFSISGLLTDDSPMPRIAATGIVKRLRTLLDFAGHYSAPALESRLSAEDSFAYLTNERGVLLQLVAKHAGLRFGVSANGVHIRFKNSI
jgi:hypothetical protein